MHRFPLRTALLVALLSPILLAAHTDLYRQIQALDDAIAQRPDDPDLYLKRANVHRRHGDWRSAQADFRRVRALDPENDSVLRL